MNKTKAIDMDFCEKRIYISPECLVIELEDEQFFCTSLTSNGDDSRDDDYDDDTEVGGGDIDIWL